MKKIKENHAFDYCKIICEAYLTRTAISKIVTV